MAKTTVRPVTNYPAQVFSWIAIMALAVWLLMGCAVPGANSGPACPSSGCVVPDTDPVPAYVPLCEPTDQGPCAEVFAGAWYYRHSGARTRLAPCPTEQGAPGNAACVWVPSAMGSNPTTGDMGAYVWGLAGASGYPLPSQVEPR